MDNKERFDQIEALLTELLRRADRQDEFNAQVIKRFDRVDERFDRVDERFDRVDEKFGHVSDQVDGIIGILKMMAEATRQSAERQEQLLREIREQGRRTDATQAEVLRQMAKWDEQEARNEAIEQRVKRLEDDTLRQAG